MQRAAVAVAGLALFAATVHGQWPQWRGPARDGVVPASSVPAAWPEKLSLSWRQDVGEGYSSPMVNDGRVYLLSRSDPDEIVSAFELESGEPIWRARYPSSFTKNQYATAMSKGPFSTPLVAGGRLFTLGVSAVLIPDRHPRRRFARGVVP
jgi:outer membrane protein assembly factor BamB